MYPLPVFTCCLPSVPPALPVTLPTLSSNAPPSLVAWLLLCPHTHCFYPEPFWEYIGHIVPLYPHVCWLFPKNRGLFYMTTIQLLESHLYFKPAQWVTLLILACQVTENPLWDGILFFILNSYQVCPLFSGYSQTLKRGPCHLASLCSYSCTQMSVYFLSCPTDTLCPAG